MAHLLDAVSLGLDDGDRVGTVGNNGAGKSSRMKLLGGSGRLGGHASQSDAPIGSRSA